MRTSSGSLDECGTRVFPASVIHTFPRSHIHALLPSSPGAPLSLASLALIASAATADAQPLGTFSWQLQPYCNIVTVHVTHDAGVYTLDGYDNQCGAATRASVAGIAFSNPDGTIGLGLTIVAAPGGNPTHVDATISPATLSGEWRDSAAATGTFAFNGAGGGVPRPLRARSAPLEIPRPYPHCPSSR